MTNEEKMTVTFSAKELFAKVDTKLDVVLERLDAKADHVALVALTDRVDTLEEEGRETKAVATALLKEKKSRLSRGEKIFVWTTVSVTTVLNVAALGPDLIHRWVG